MKLGNSSASSRSPCCHFWIHRNEGNVHVPRGNRVVDRVAEGRDYADSICYKDNKMRHSDYIPDDLDDGE